MEIRFKYLQTGKLIMTCLIFAGSHTEAQDYHAINGSTEVGSLGVSNNPASIVNIPFAWDLTLFSMQLTNATNAISIYNYAYLLPTKGSEWAFSDGGQSRELTLHANIRLFNARLALDRKQAIAFGAALRSYTHARISAFDYNDTLHNLNNFFGVNNPATIFSAHSASSSWLELFGTYSRTLYNDGFHRLNAGLTLQLQRAISGAYASLQNGTVQANSKPGDTSFYYTLHTAQVQYGYSSNYDRWKNGQPITQNLKDFLGDTRGSLGMDLGVEYLIGDGEPLVYSGRDEYYDYRWKIGISLLDLGSKKYKYGSQSRLAFSPRPGVADSLLDRKLDGMGSLAAFNDTLGGVFNTLVPLNGVFEITDPTRLVINVDHWLTGNFFINGELSLNLGPSDGGNKLGVQETSLLTLTPRWETGKWGFYLPVQYNALGQLLVGLACKAGPLLIGVHNLANLFGRFSTQNGGGYMAIILHAGHGVSAARDKRFREYDCPK